jgi:hypothetical protein
MSMRCSLTRDYNFFFLFFFSPSDLKPSKVIYMLLKSVSCFVVEIYLYFNAPITLQGFRSKSGSGHDGGGFSTGPTSS